ncbi:MAG: hypothetical protein QGF90_07250, partial [Gammaproteobacteria bacterium]|nr:hypothetical protein [Gammaproteobacteria bacterium]
GAGRTQPARRFYLAQPEDGPGRSARPLKGIGSLPTWVTGVLMRANIGIRFEPKITRSQQSTLIASRALPVEKCSAGGSPPWKIFAIDQTDRND